MVSAVFCFLLASERQMEILTKNFSSFSFCKNNNNNNILQVLYGRRQRPSEPSRHPRLKRRHIGPVSLFLFSSLSLHPEYSLKIKKKPEILSDFPVSSSFSGLPYFRIFETTPAPTVRPPSRIAKRKPSSIATGAISFAVIVMLSPGITISVPSGSSIEPVTSVVRK